MTFFIHSFLFDGQTIAGLLLTPDLYQLTPLDIRGSQFQTIRVRVLCTHIAGAHPLDRVGDKFYLGVFLMDAARCGFRCSAEACTDLVGSILDLVNCVRCAATFHKRCLGMVPGVGTFSVPYCPRCKRDTDCFLLAYENAVASERALAGSTLSSLNSRVRQMERVLYDVLGLGFADTLPREGVLARAPLLHFLLARRSEGASRAMVLSELKLWKDTLLEIGEATMPADWLHLKVHRLFP